MKIKRILLTSVSCILLGACTLPFILGGRNANPTENDTVQNNETVTENMINQENAEKESATLVSGESVDGGLSMAKVFANGMVLQRQKPINVYGYANNGANVTVTLGESTGTATAVNGEWKVTLPSMEAAKGLTLTVASGSEELVYTDVAIGEVMVVSGQSNAQYTAYQLEDWDELALLCETYNNIRIFAETSNYVLEEHKYGFGQWIDGSRSSLEKAGVAGGNISAIGYVAATKLAAELGPDITVALISVSRSATNINAWISEDVLRENESVYSTEIAKLQAYQDFYAQNGRLPNNSSECIYYNSNSIYKFLPSVCYNAMIAPLEGYTARSFVWYQGESNASEGSLYITKFAHMREQLLKIFCNEDLECFVVQIAPYNSSGIDAFEAVQYDLALQIPNTHLISTGIDGSPLHLQDILYGPPASVIHPSRKTPLGLRIADRILAEVYGRTEEIVTAPTLLSVTKGTGTVTLTFDTDLRLLRGIAPEGFEVSDANGTWHTVTGVIEGKTLILNTSAISSPKEVRYCFGMRYIELETGELLPLIVGSSLKLSDDGNYIIYSYGNYYYEFKSEDGQVIRVIKSGNITNASGEPMPTFKVTIE